MEAQTHGTGTSGTANSELGGSAHHAAGLTHHTADLTRETGADARAAESRQDDRDLERRVSLIEAVLAATGGQGSGRLVGAAQDGLNGAAEAATDAGPSAEEIARAADEAAKAEALYRATINEHEFAVATAAHGIDLVIARACELYGLLIWTPERIGEAGRLITLAENSFAGLRSTLAAVETHAKAVATLGPPPADPIDDLAGRYDDALTRMRAARRRLDGLISLAETDIMNGPALDATARALQEEIALSTFASMGLTLALNRLGLAR